MLAATEGLFGQTALVLLGVALGLALLVMLGLMRREAAGREKRQREVDRLSAEVRDLTRALRRVEGEQGFLTRFLREFPDLTRQLGGESRYRDVPVALSTILMRIFEPEQVAVLVRTTSDGEECLVVSAVMPESGPVSPGARAPLALGELGFVARTQRVMDTTDFENERRRSAELELTSLPEFTTDLAAPLAIDGRTLGVVALSGVRPQRAHAKEVLRLVAHVGSLTLKSVSAFQRVKSAADVDSLTGIFNKRVLNFKLGECLFEAERRREPLSLFMFDIDNFKNYNDTNGHVAGDELLKTLTGLVAANVRSDDIFGRFGGEEFMLVLPGRGEAQALVVAQKIRLVIANHDFPHGAAQPLGSVTVSGGVATYPVDASTSVTLVRAADTALYRAKENGRNQVLAYSKLGPGELSEPAPGETLPA